MKTLTGWIIGVSGWAFINAAAGGPGPIDWRFWALVVGVTIVVFGNSIRDSAKRGRWPWEEELS